VRSDQIANQGVSVVALRRSSPSWPSCSGRSTG